MPALADLYRRVVPEAPRRVLTGAIRRSAWELGVVRLKMLPRGSVPSDRTLRLLRFGWGNPLYSSGVAYLREVATRCRTGRGSIVEAGSGLTTVLIGHLAPAGRSVVAYEHMAEWAERVDRRLGGRSPVRLTELRDHGGFEWYALDPPPPDEVGLLVCDGPPGSAKGGRYGALALLRDRLSEDSVILLDDAERDGERAVLRRWTAEFGATVDVRGQGSDTYAVVRLAP